MAISDDYLEFVEKHGKGKSKRVFWDIDLYAQAVPLRYPGFSLVEGQEWKGSMAKYKLVCPKHGEYEVSASNFLNSSGLCNLGPGCD